MLAVTDNPIRSSSARAGFTLLELIIAITMLAVFIVPMLKTLGESRNRSVTYTRQRQVKGYAQKQLHDHINFVEDRYGNLVGTDGTFEEEGEEVFPGSRDWTWEIDPPQLKSQGEQMLLEYRITVTVPFEMEGGSGQGSEDGQKESSITYTVWTFPSKRWEYDQMDLFELGEPTILYGDPNYDDGTLPAPLPGAGR